MTSQAPVITEEIRQQSIGTESPPVTLEVEKGAIARFSEAIEDPNPLYIDEVTARRSRYGGIIATPTFLRNLRTERLELPFEEKFQRVLDGGSEWEYFEPVRVGDRITAVNRVTDVSERAGRLGPMIFVSTVTTYTNQLDQVVATQKSTLIRY